jgi:hypothetical protein
MQLVSPGASPCSAQPVVELAAGGSNSCSFPVQLVDRIRSTWQSLIASNSTLYCILLAVNAWALAYTGLVHDARLYGIQLVNRTNGGTFANDLYLQFGSQDRYTIFSTLAAPLVQTLGLRLAFLLVYCVSLAVFLWGMQRLVLALCDNRLVASLALLFLATTTITFAGLETFYVNESFVTPRLAANGLTLWALALLLEGRTASAFLLMVGALALHPLMACGGFLTCVAYWMSSRFTKWHAWILGALLLPGCALVCFEVIPDRFLGQMDAGWRDATRRANPYNFPSEWAGQDWLHLLIAVGIASAACGGLLRRSDRGRLILCVTGVGIAGLIVNVIAGQLPYALPLQGQGYRWLWLLQFLQVPLGFALIHSWWQQGSLSSRTAAMIVAAYLGSRMGNQQQFLALLVSLASFAYCLSTWHNSGPSLRGVLVAMAGACWLLYHEANALLDYWRMTSSVIDPIDIVRTSPPVLFAFTRLAVAGMFVLALTWLCRSQSAGRLALISCAGLLQIGFFASTTYAESNRPASGVTMVRNYLKEHPGPAHPTVYWPLGWVNQLWFDLNVDSYFEPMQIAGNVFSRQNAMEGERRIQLVKRFELERIRDTAQIYSPLQIEQLEALFGARLDEPAPGWNDLRALCADPRLDYLMLRQNFPGRFVATDGAWFLYDCQAIRSSKASLTKTDKPDARVQVP